MSALTSCSFYVQQRMQPNQALPITLQDDFCFRNPLTLRTIALTLSPSTAGKDDTSPPADCFALPSCLYSGWAYFSTANGSSFSNDCGSLLPKLANTAEPVTKNTMEGTNRAKGHEPVLSRMAPVMVTPMMPGIAPVVLVRPNSTGA